VVWQLADELLSDSKQLVKLREIYKKHQRAKLNDERIKIGMPTKIFIQRFQPTNQTSETL
jgi:hypothetical protein